jgi:hypothetical protein|tara:strand:+ start:5479 stop:5916 length:438 start_codon:yes stop_codon:yes gene_type:complete
MKAKTFENLIRKIVREEIDYALRREIKSLKEDLRDEVKPIIKEQPIIDTPVSNNIKNSLKEKIMGKKPIKKQNFVKDNTLNDLLNETAMSNTNTQTAHAPVSLSKPFATGAPLPMETAGMPESVANAVTRDYSDLMKAIARKKGN